MKRAILIVVILLMAGWAVFEFVSSSDDTAVEESTERSSGDEVMTPPSAEDEAGGDVEKTDEVGLTEGDIAPDFELETLDGETVQLSDYKGERVIVNFWATWCPPCREEIPDLKKLYDKKDVEILAVNLTDSEEDEEKVDEFVDDFDMPFPIPMDKDGDLAEKYNIVAYPTSYMIDSSGHIQLAKLGPMPYDLMTEELSDLD